MRTKYMWIVGLVLAMTTTLGGLGEAQEIPTKNQRPVVTWVGPASGSTVPAYSPITFQVTASDPDGTVASVMFYKTNNGQIIASTTSSPYKATWFAAAPGTYSIGVLVRDNLGLGGGAPAISLTVAPATPSSSYTLTVNSGTGGGKYASGTQVTITANAPPAGQVFKQWSGAAVQSTTGATTTLTMPAANATVTANYYTPVPISQPVSAHPRLWVTPSDLPRLQAWASAANPVYAQGMLPVLNQVVQAYQTRFFPGGVAAVPYPDDGDFNGYGAYNGFETEQFMLVLAFNSLIDPNSANRTLYAKYARNLLMYAINESAKGFLIA